MEELSAELDAKLVKIREDYEERKNDTDDLEFRAMTSGISVSQVLEALEEEKEEEERVVIRDINLERDGAMARKLQAEDTVEDDSGPYLISSSPPPSSPWWRRDRGPSHSPCSIIQRSASIAAMQPVPAAVTAWR